MDAKRSHEAAPNLQGTRLTNHEHLAAAVDVAAMSVNNWERGLTQPRHSAPEPYAQRLAAVLQTPIEILLAPENEEKETATGVTASQSVAKHTTGARSYD